MTDSLTWSDLEFIEPLGSGAAGSVGKFKLRKSLKDFPEGSYVAIKQYKSWLLEDEPGMMERILRELDDGRKIRHRNLVRTVTIVIDNKGNPALVMHFYPGISLQNYLEDKRKSNTLRDLEFIFKVIGGLAGALNAIHKKGRIHRDVKPANILITDDNEPVLMDLGVIKRRRDVVDITATGKFLGTIKYAAPECVFGEDYDYKADVYSFGAVSYELIMGREFMGGERHWATLIRDKALTANFNFAFERTEDLNTDVQQALESKYGLKALRFLLYILESSLVYSNYVHKVGARNLDLKSVNLAIRGKWWKNGDYSFDNGSFVKGYPKFPPLDPDTTNTNAVRVKLSRLTMDYPIMDSPSSEERKDAKEIVSDVINGVTPETSRSLRNLVKATLWDTNFDGGEIEVSHSHWEKLEAIGAITYSDYDKYDDRVLYSIPDSLKYAYIYDLLHYPESSVTKGFIPF